MADLDVMVIRTGTANLASMIAGLKRIGANPKICETPKEVEESQRLVLPGVGTLAAAMDALEAADFVAPLQRRIQQGRATLAVCLGLQLLCEGSEESPGRAGLGIFPGQVTRFGPQLRVPQLGWNLITPSAGCKMLEEGYVYFANSYRLEHTPPGWQAALADYGGSFVAALERGSILACQFHPELSGKFGITLLRKWFEEACEDTRKEGAPC